VTRDDDLLRQMLFDFEASKDYLILDRKSLGMSEDERKWQHHLDLLCDQGFVRQISSSGYRLTSAGHDFINAIRSDTAWEKTKDGAVKIGGATLGMMADMAVAYLKQEAAEKLGINL